LLELILTNLKEINPDISPINPDIAEINPDIAEINPDISQINPDIAEIKINPDIAEINPDISQINPDIAEINPDISQINPDIAEIKINPDISMNCSGQENEIQTNCEEGQVVGLRIFLPDPNDPSWYTPADENPPKMKNISIENLLKMYGSEALVLLEVESVGSVEKPCASSYM
jgi:peptidoglycan hydrolase CwlO-like protein